MADSFPSANERDWRALVEQGDPGRRIRPGASDDGVPIDPVYAGAHDRGCVWSRPQDHSWTIVQRFAGHDAPTVPGELDEESRAIPGALELAFRNSDHPIKSYWDASDVNDLGRFARAFGLTHIRIDAGAKTTDIGALFVRQFDSHPQTLVLSFDPAGTSAIRGSLDQPLEDLAGEALAAFESLGSDVTLFVADGRLWHAGGASEVQELAAVLATFVTHSRALVSAGLPLEQALERVGLILAADADQLLTIAKLRAMRLLHARLLEVLGQPLGPCRIHVETAWRMMSRRDASTNLLRTTGAAFSAAVGGADSITVLPFDLSKGATTHGQRLARNIQLILSMEARVGAAADPAAGSGAIEALTDALAAAAWEKFREIEKAGGMMEAVRDQTFLRDVAATRDRRLARVAAGKDTLIGVNAFLDESEASADGTKVAATDSGKAADRLVFTRLSEPFESEPISRAPEEAGS